MKNIWDLHNKIREVLMLNAQDIIGLVITGILTILWTDIRKVGKSKTEKEIETALQNAFVSDVKNMIQIASQGKSRNITRIKECPIHALYVTINALKNAKSLEEDLEALLKTKGDRRVNIPVACFVLGLLYGFEAIDKSKKVSSIVWNSVRMAVFPRMESSPNRNPWTGVWMR